MIVVKIITVGHLMVSEISMPEHRTPLVVHVFHFVFSMRKFDREKWYLAGDKSIRLGTNNGARGVAVRLEKQQVEERQRDGEISPLDLSRSWRWQRRLRGVDATP